MIVVMTYSTINSAVEEIAPVAIIRDFCIHADLPLSLTSLPLLPSCYENWNFRGMLFLQRF